MKRKARDDKEEERTPSGDKQDSTKDKKKSKKRKEEDYSWLDTQFPDYDSFVAALRRYGYRLSNPTPTRESKYCTQCSKKFKWLRKENGKRKGDEKEKENEKEKGDEDKQPEEKDIDCAQLVFSQVVEGCLVGKGPSKRLREWELYWYVFAFCCSMACADDIIGCLACGGLYNNWRVFSDVTNTGQKFVISSTAHHHASVNRMQMQPLRNRSHCLPWSVKTHAEWPKRFKDIVKTLLLACTTTTTNNNDNNNTHNKAKYPHVWLPLELVLNIVGWIAWDWDWTEECLQWAKENEDEEDLLS